MTPERWQEVKKMLAAALERLPGERQAYLEQACAEPALRREVESLILAHEQAPTTFLAHPAAQPRELAIGSRLGPYEILALIGAGGMGVVYRARDERLERDVALKVLPAGLLADETVRRRFRKEALALAKLSHPNIAVIHDFGEDGGVNYLVMEYVLGQSLAEKLKLGALPEIELISLGDQIAAALEEAHEHGIVHRDLKPANIMVTPKGQAKVLDFGLAKLLAPAEAGDVTQSVAEGEVAGTLPYMAPEQLLGEPADARTDLWALGVVLYEAATGQRPFSETLSSRLIDAILHQQPVAPRILNPRLSEETESILNKALARDRSLRYQTSSEMRADINRVQYGLAPEHLTTIALTKGRRAREFTAAFLAALLLGSGVAAIPSVRARIRGWLGAGAIPQERQLAVLPFEVAGGDPSAKAFSDGLTETLTAKLAQLTTSHPLVVISASAVRARRVMTADQARQEFGVNLALEGNLVRSGDRVRVNCNLVDTRTHRQLRADSITVVTSDPFEVQDEVVNGALRMLDLEVQPPGLEPLETHVTPVPGAYDLYLQARGYLQDYDKVENLDSAITVFKQALALDPDFALAYAGLGEAYWQKYVASKDARWVASARDACERALRPDPKLTAAHVCLGRIESGSGEYEKAAVEFERAVETEPTSDDAYRGLADAYEGLGKPAEAEKTYRRAIELRPRYWVPYSALGTFYDRQARYAEAASMFSQVIALAPDSIRGYYDLGAMYIYQGRYADAISMFQRSIAIRPTAGAYSNLGSAYFYLRRYYEADSAYGEALKLSQNNYVLWWNVGEGYYWTPGKRADSAQYYRQAISRAKESLQVNPRDAYVLGVLAYCHAMLGERKPALDYLQEGLTLAPEDSEIRFKAALVYTQFGELTQALDWLKKALVAGFSATVVRDTPNFDALRSDPRFKALIDAK